MCFPSRQSSLPVKWSRYDDYRRDTRGLYASTTTLKLSTTFKHVESIPPSKINKIDYVHSESISGKYEHERHSLLKPHEWCDIIGDRAQITQITIAGIYLSKIEAWTCQKDRGLWSNRYSIDHQYNTWTSEMITKMWYRQVNMDTGCVADKKEVPPSRKRKSRTKQWTVEYLKEINKGLTAGQRVISRLGGTLQLPYLMPALWWPGSSISWTKHCRNFSVTTVE